MIECILMALGALLILALWAWGCHKDDEWLLRQESEWLEEEIERTTDDDED